MTVTIQTSVITVIHNHNKKRKQNIGMVTNGNDRNEVPRRPVGQLEHKTFLKHCSSALESAQHSRHLDLDMVECHTLP
jgi:hypothetical protein